MNVKKNRILKRLTKICACIVAIILVCLIVTNMVVVLSTKSQVVGEIDLANSSLSKTQIEKLDKLDAECIIVLGASVYSNGNPSPMLQERLDVAVELYKKGVAPALLLSGDNGELNYNELRVMAKYVENAGVKKEDIFCDYAGFSTYDTVYRAKEIFQVDKAVVVTQKYHLYRTLYGCKEKGIEALGVTADQQTYSSQSTRYLREVLARTKDSFKWIANPEPRFLGDAIPIDGKGNSKF